MKYLLLFFTILFTWSASLQADSVVCIHGFIRSYRCMLPMGNALEDAGFHVFLWDYPTRQNTIEGHANNLVSILKEIAKKYPGEPIHFVSHSMGGLVAKTAVNHPECPQEATQGKAVLLAPPMQGSSLARALHNVYPIRWIFGRNAGYQLQTYGPQEMAQLGHFPHTMGVMVISGAKGSRFFFKSPNDGKVSVEETRVEAVDFHHVVIYASHSWIMTSSESIELTRDFLMTELKN